MKNLIKISFLVYIIIELVIRHRASYKEIVILLLITACNVFMEKYYNGVPVLIASSVLIAAASAINAGFAVLFCLAVFDFVHRRIYAGAVPVLIYSGYFLYKDDNFILIFLLMAVCALLGYIIQKTGEKENKYKTSLDDERRLRYELEQTKARLLNAAREAAGIAEVSERNRIARQIHDSVGHSIAGILIQLQAAYKLYGRNDAKSMEILKNSIDSLSGAVTLLRDTVHNIKPRESLGVDYIREIIDKFTFCPVEFRFSGDFNLLPSNHFEIIGANIREALTNASRYSKASKIDISIGINERYTRFYFKDNGVGCDRIKEGLGLSGMRERIGNIGGTISISSENGFMIVCLLPRDCMEGSGVFEGTYNR